MESHEEHRSHLTFTLTVSVLKYHVGLTTITLYMCVSPSSEKTNTFSLCVLELCGCVSVSV